MKSFYTLLAFSILLASCGTSNSVTSNHFLQKRKYTSGWHFNNQQREVSSNNESKRENKTTDVSLNSTINLGESTSNLIEFRSSVQEECDTIILNDGKIVRAKIISTSDSTIQYTKCESDDPTEFTMDKHNVKALQYGNGKFEFVKHYNSQEAHKLELDQREIDKKKGIEAQEKEWMIRNNTNITKKELKEKLKLETSLVLIMGFLFILCLILSFVSAVASTAGGLPSYIFLILLVLTILFLIAFFVAIKHRQNKKEILLNGEKVEKD